MFLQCSESQRELQRLDHSSWELAAAPDQVCLRQDRFSQSLIFQHSRSGPRNKWLHLRQIAVFTRHMLKPDWRISEKCNTQKQMMHFIFKWYESVRSNLLHLSQIGRQKVLISHIQNLGYISVDGVADIDGAGLRISHFKLKGNFKISLVGNARTVIHWGH